MKSPLITSLLQTIGNHRTQIKHIICEINTNKYKGDIIYDRKKIKYTCMKLFFKIIFFFSFLTSFSQEGVYPPPMIAVDSLYREDQFYAGFTYNSLFNAPDHISQDKFSAGFTAGFLRDMPINKKRTIAIAPGLGLSYNKSFNNLSISANNQGYDYAVLSSDVYYKKNKLEEMYVDVPIEFRWRNSTPESTKFWRIYAGVKFSYMLFSKYVNETDGVKTVIMNSDDINKFQISPTLSFGYNTWNAYACYGAIPIFKDSAQLNGQAVGFNIFSLGLMFYIL